MQIAANLFRTNPALRRLYSTLGVIAPDEYITLDNALDEEHVEVTVTIAGVEFNLCDLADAFTDDEAAGMRDALTTAERAADDARANLHAMRQQRDDALTNVHALEERLQALQDTAQTITQGGEVTATMVLRSAEISREDATYIAQTLAYGRAARAGTAAAHQALETYPWLFQEVPLTVDPDVADLRAWQSTAVDLDACEVSDFLRGAILAEFSGRLHHPARIAGTYVIISAAQLRQVVNRTTRAIRLQQAALVHAQVQRAALQSRIADVLEANTQAAATDVNTAVVLGNAVEVALAELGITPKY